MVETTQKAVTTLELDEDISSVDTDSIKAELAALYGVPAASIKLSASAGSTILSVQIVESSGLALSDISAAMSATDDAALSSALGISVTTTAESAMREREVVLPFVVTPLGPAPQGWGESIV